MLSQKADQLEEYTNALDALFQLNKDFIMSSKFQNNLYKGQKVCEYLGKKPSTFKIGNSFSALLNKMIDKLPSISYEKLIQNRRIYEKYPHLYLRFIGSHNYLVNIGALCRHCDAYANSSEIPIYFYLPSTRSLGSIFLPKQAEMRDMLHREETYQLKQRNYFCICFILMSRMKKF